MRETTSTPRSARWAMASACLLGLLLAVVSCSGDPDVIVLSADGSAKTQEAGRDDGGHSGVTGYSTDGSALDGRGAGADTDGSADAGGNEDAAAESGSSEPDGPGPDGTAPPTPESGSNTSDGNGTMSLAGWQAEMEELCALSQQSLVDINPLDFEAMAEANAEAMRSSLDVLRATPRPAGHEAEVDELVAVTEALVAAYDRNGAAALMTLGDPGSELGGRLQRVTGALGLDDCGDQSAQASALCARVPEDQVAKLLGSVPALESSVGPGGETCQWAVGRDHVVAVTSGSTGLFDDALVAIRDWAFQPVSGLGDEAHMAEGFSTSSRGTTAGTSIWVVDGDRVYIVAAIVDDGPPDQALLTELAVAVVGG